ncbi:MAG: TIR domain-containing protein [Deltaproteobacteria bacterium]|jgi:HJR/Mrr/RecB family endonuclease|nr:TIR domain-containing protein [Deltaproteobacteria bacterium]
MNYKNRVFLSYCSADRETAHLISEKLSTENIKIVGDYDFDPGSNVLDNLRYLVETSEIVLLLLSKKYVQSAYTDYELQKFLDESQKRKITIIPVVIERCKVPLQLKYYNIIHLYNDFEKGLEKVRRQISTIPQISFSDFTPHSFEEFIHQLLTEYGFINIRREKNSPDFGIDFIAENFTRNPFGMIRKETWVIEVKFYKNERFSINTLKQLFEYKRNILPADSKMLLITNSILTSVAEEYLNDIQKIENTQIEVIDGLVLKNLIARRKKLISKFLKP